MMKYIPNICYFFNSATCLRPLKLCAGCLGCMVKKRKGQSEKPKTSPRLGIIEVLSLILALMDLAFNLLPVGS